MKSPHWKVAGLLLVLVTLGVRAEPRLMARLGDEVLPVVQSKDEKLWVVRDGTPVGLSPSAELIIEDAAGEVSGFALWSPNYVIRVRTDPERRRDPATHASRLAVRGGVDSDEVGGGSPARMATTWPGSLGKNGAIVFGWILDGRVERVSARPYDGSNARGSVFFSELLLSESMVRGQPVVLLWEEGAFKVPSLESKDAKLDAAIRAALTDRGADLAALLKTGVSPNAVNPGSGMSLMALAAESGSASAIDALIAAKAKVDFGGAEKPSPLLFAANNGRAAAVARLLAGRAAKNAKGTFNRTALYAAAQRGHVEAARELIAAKAELNTLADDSTSTFTIAVDNGYADVARLILDAGFKYDFRQEQCERVLFSQAARGFTGVVRLFLEKGVKADGLFRGYTALHSAAAFGDTESVRLLLAAGSDANRTGQLGETALSRAALSGHSETVAALLAGGANPAIADLQGNTALHAAVSGHSTASAEALLAAGAPVDVPNNGGLSPFGLALIADLPHLAGILHGKGARLDLNSPRVAEFVDGMIRLDLANLLEAALSDGLSPTFEVKPGWTLGAAAGAYRAENCQRVVAQATGAPARAAILSASELTVRPKVRSAAMPPDPRSLAETFPEAAVSLEVVIDAEGAPVFVRVLSADQPTLGLLARQAMAQWKFQPAEKDGAPVATTVSIPLRFPSSRDRARDASDVDVLPRVRFQAHPVYPMSMRRSNLVGQVVVQFVVNQQGRTESMEAVRSSHPDFEEAAIEAVGKWVFNPGQRDGKPVNVKMQVPIIFSLR